MRSETVFLLGAAGHGKVVLDALLESGVAPERIVVADDNLELRGRDLRGFKVCTPAIQAAAAQGFFHVSIGNATVRQRLSEELEALGSLPLTVVHPAATVSQSASVSAGVFVGAQAVVGPAAHIGRGVIVNHGAVVDHDCSIGEYTHVAPNATLGGAVRIGKRVLLGAGSTILPGNRIGDDAVIGAGAVVLNDVGIGETWVGVPACIAYSK